MDVREPMAQPSATEANVANGGRQPLVTAIILNTNRREDTLACLASLAHSTYRNCRIIVLDNASTDGSVEAIRTGYPSVDVVPIVDNKGYAGNNNVGIAEALEGDADWILVLNEDTVLAPDCVERLVFAGEQDPQIGFVGPLVLHYDEPTVIQSAGGTLDGSWSAIHDGQNEVDVGQYSEPRQVDWISGCAIVARSRMVREIGSLDERYFYYWEETEWCLRARQNGWQIVHVPDARLWHKGVQRDYQPGPDVTYYNTRNRLLTMAKHSASASAWAAVWMTLLRTELSWSIRPRWRETKRDHRKALLQGAVDFSRGRWGIRGS